MNFSIQREALLKPLQLMSGIVERRQTLPILSNILLSSRDGMLSVTGTDIEIELVAEVPLEDGTDGVITLPARKLLDICRTLPDSAIIEITIDNERATLRSGKSRFTLSTLPACDFPNMENMVGHRNVVLPQNALKYLIDKTQFAMAQQDVRYYLNGLLLELSENSIRCVATDGHRLAYCETTSAENFGDTTQVIIPRKAVAELSRLLSDTNDEIELSFSANFIRVSLNGTTFTSKLIDGRFPDYKRVIPHNCDKHLTAIKEAFKQALVRASILSNEKYRGVRLVLGDNSVQVFANNPELEEAEETLDVEYQGASLEIGFNVTYMIDALNAVDSQNIDLSFTDSNSSSLIQCEHNGMHSKYVIMPMRL